MIRVVYKKPRERPYELEIENTLEKFQELVEGYIEVYSIKKDNSIAVVINEDGKLKGLKPNINYGNGHIVGNIVFVQCKNGNFCSLTDEMVNEIMEKLK